MVKKSLLRPLFALGMFLMNSAQSVNAQNEVNTYLSVAYSRPTWSSDGKQIAVTAYDGVHYNILITEVENSKFTRLFPDDNSNNRLPKWSPNGRFIAFNSDRAGKWDLWVKETNSPNTINLTAEHQAEVVEYEWSPDGQLIAFIAMEVSTLSTELWITRPDGTNQMNLTPDFSYILYEGLAWDPYSQFIAFAAADLNVMQRKGIWRASINETSPIPLTLDQNDFHVAWASTGRLAVTRQNEDNLDIWRFDADGSDAVNLTPDNPDPDTGPVWTRDGQSLLFMSERFNQWGIWFMSVGGSNLINVTRNMNGECINPALSPDETRIVFQFYPSEQPRPNRSAEIWMINLDGTNPVNLTPSADQVAFVPQTND